MVGWVGGWCIGWCLWGFVVCWLRTQAQQQQANKQPHAKPSPTNKQATAGRTRRVSGLLVYVAHKPGPKHGVWHAAVALKRAVAWPRGGFLVSAWRGVLGGCVPMGTVGLDSSPEGLPNKNHDALLSNAALGLPAQPSRPPRPPGPLSRTAPQAPAPALLPVAPPARPVNKTTENPWSC